MTSSRPYLLRALHQWISDNGMTPHLLVDVTVPGVEVPAGVDQEGKVNLNVGYDAVRDLHLENDLIEFNARFSGVARHVQVPPAAVLAIYARENGQGMMFPPEEEEPRDPDATGSDKDSAESSGDDKLDRGHLRVIK